MTDNEIIKALEKARDVVEKDDDSKYAVEFCEDAIALFNRQKSELETLKAERNNYKEWYFDTVEELKTAKSEAVKEFAERLKEKNDNPGKAMFDVYEYYGETIDNLVKEMTEGKENA